MSQAPGIDIEEDSQAPKRLPWRLSDALHGDWNEDNAPTWGMAMRVMMADDERSVGMRGLGDFAVAYAQVIHFAHPLMADHMRAELAQMPAEWRVRLAKAFVEQWKCSETSRPQFGGLLGESMPTCFRFLCEGRDPMEQALACIPAGSGPEWLPNALRAWVEAAELGSQTAPAPSCKPNAL